MGCGPLTEVDIHEQDNQNVIYTTKRSKFETVVSGPRYMIVVVHTSNRRSSGNVRDPRGIERRRYVCDESCSDQFPHQLIESFNACEMY
jgi:hypothetical protein